MQIIKGDWCDKSEEVARAQSGPFIFVNSNGSKWAGQEPDSVKELLDVLELEPLDRSFERYGNFITLNPCEGVRNPDWCYGSPSGVEPWIDGKRIFAVDGVAHFFGNFFKLSHVFSIYTNDADTISKLTKAIRANQLRRDYLSQDNPTEQTTNHRTAK